MSTTTASTNNLYRVGGVAAILGILIMFGATTLPLLVGIGFLVLAAYYFALYRADSSALNLIATLSTVGGGVLALFTAATPNHLYNVAFVTGLVLPPLFAGLAFNGKADFPRALAIAGIVGGVFGILNFVVAAIGGGDYTNPNNPALTPFIYGTYAPSMLAIMVWLVWGGIRLFRKA
jgi:hypothetical protein